MKTYEFNFVDPNVPPAYAELLMGPYEDDDGITIHLTSEYRSMAHILAKIVFFKSVSEAKRNGWDKPIPQGFSKHTVGKGDKMKVVYILSDCPSWHEEIKD